jgi:DNA polymerase-3 subunit alpha
MRDQITKELFELGSLIVNFPNIRSVHAGGILISEDPITCYTALDMPPKGLPTTQWDMYVAENLRFEKLDILSQRGIGHINDCAELVLQNKKKKIDVHRVEKFKKDPKVNRRLYNGEAIGCFYVESPAMRGLLKKLHCDNYLTLVAASSIIRPGVAKSGMMKEYINRFHDPEGFEYLHPVMKEQLEETYGVMVYQEDVIKICHHFAGLDLSDADILRRAMAGKFRSRIQFEEIQDKFFNNCAERGYGIELTKEVWRQIASFAGYAFSKAHSASYAVESYQSLFLKTYFPHEFMVAVINNFGGFYRTWVYFNEARRCGANIHLPCVNHSLYNTTIYDRDIYIGFVHVQNLEAKLAKYIVEEREMHGKYKDLHDFISRIPIGNEQMVILIRLNSMRFTGKSKKQLLWEAHMILGKSTKKPVSNSLFTEKPKSFQLPPLTQNSIEDAYDEVELLGFPVSMSMFDMLQTKYRGKFRAHDLKNNIGKTIRILGNLVTIKNVRTVRKECMHFGCFLDNDGEFFDTVNFPDSLKKYPFRGYGIYLILGKVVEEFGFPSIEVHKMAKLPLMKDPRY